MGLVSYLFGFEYFRDLNDVVINKNSLYGMTAEVFYYLTGSHVVPVVENNFPDEVYNHFSLNDSIRKKNYEKSKRYILSLA